MVLVVAEVAVAFVVLRAALLDVDLAGGHVPSVVVLAAPLL